MLTARMMMAAEIQMATVRRGGLNSSTAIPNITADCDELYSPDAARLLVVPLRLILAAGRPSASLGLFHPGRRPAPPSPTSSG
jgi:hypothetical protein